MNKSTNLSFDDLLRDVINKGLCNKCGACVSFCTADQIGAIEMCDCFERLPRYIDPDKCFRCGICYLICPQTHDLNEDIKQEFGWSPPIGSFREIISAQATDEEIKEVATDGGVVTALLSYMLENKIIDGAIVAKRTGLFDRQPDIATTREMLIQAAGSQFSESSQLGEVGKEYSTYVPILPTVRMFGMKPSLKLAVVGTPCQITAVRKMQVLNILPSDVIFFTIGLFCMQCFTFDNLMGKTFIKRYHIKPEDILKINVKEDFRIELKSGLTIHIPFDEIQDIARPPCLACQDFANDFADISVGGLGSADGYTTSIIRTTLGKRMFANAVNHNYIKPADISEENKRSILSLVENFVEKKKKRSKTWTEILGFSDIYHAIDVGEGDKINLCAECERLNNNLNWIVNFVSHELSSMLGTIIMNISALADQEVACRLEENKKNSMLIRALNSLKLMKDMIQNYLASSKIKTGHLSFTPTRVNLGKEITSQIIKRLESLLITKSMSFVCDRCDTMEVTCDKSLIRIAINNLINNAIKYGTPKTTIHGSLIKAKDGFEFRITNEGIGIPENKLDSVFDEFARFEKNGIEGTGLGLYLVKRIVSLHKGNIRVESGYIINKKLITYELIRKNPELYNIDIEDKKLRKFATFILCIPGCKPEDSGIETKSEDQKRRK
ncbi:MAG: Coenzyme F420 hydrogenase/dehydrogenase, beta subunit C-terminal domain [Candidatus Cloacimonetes bacterium]|nr:Coenzyme F420 hydrogenase/dehydrogenase, beta subunit C-terminal domain [Candidatus Cloacimonadota bacterium]